MNKLKKLIAYYIFDEHLSLGERNVNLAYSCGAVTVLLALFAHFFELSPPVLLFVIVGIFVTTLTLFILKNRFRRMNPPMVIGLLVLGDVLFPVVFFLNGGASSGMTAYFVLIVAALFLVLGGRRRMCLLLVFVAVVAGCYYAEYRYAPFLRGIQKDVLRPLTGIPQYIDNIQSFLLCGLFIGCVLKFQQRLYTREQKKTLAARGRWVRQNELLQVINNAAVKILTAGQEQFSQSVTDSVAMMAECIDADRAYIFRYQGEEDGVTAYTSLCEWTAEDSLKQGITLVRGNEMPPGWEEKLKQGDPLGGAFSKLLPEERENLRENGVKSILCVPVFVNDLFWGFMLFDDCHSERDFLDDEVDILRSAALMLANAMERNYAQTRMTEAEERARILVDEAPLGIMFWNEELRLTDCNAEALRLFAAESKEELLSNFYDFAPATQQDGMPSREKLLRVLEETLETGIGVHEWSFLDKEGNPLPTEITLTRVKRGESAVVLVYFRDLRELKRMLSEINARDMLLRRVNEIASILLQTSSASFDSDFSICCEMLMKSVNTDRLHIWKRDSKDGKAGYTLYYVWDENLLGHYFVTGGDAAPNELFLGWDERLQRGESLNGPAASFPADARQTLTKDGIVSILAVPIFLQNQLWGMANFCDFYTERKFSPMEEMILKSGTLFLANAIERNNTRKNLIAAQEEALSNSKAKSAFLAIMSHEIRTPLNAIIGLAELQLQKRLPVPVRAAMEKILASGSTLLAIINDMLDISKIESGSLEIAPVNYDVPSLINDTAQLNVVRIGSKPVTFKMQIDPTLPSRLFGDELRVKQVLNNVLSNAFKYTREGFVLFTAGWEKGESPEGKEKARILCSVTDSGIGIKEEDLGKLFLEYSQFDTQANRTIEGTGLGLSITKKLVEMMGGAISVESEYGKGSTFTVTFLQDVVDPKPIGESVAKNLETFMYFSGKRNSARNITRADMSYASILVVDDVQTNLDVTRGFLLPYNITVDCVLSGQAAIDKIREGKRKYDAIFMDHMMPEMDGIEATQIIRSLGTEYAKKVPIIALTANALAGNEEMFLQNGFDAFIPKPIDARRLDAILNRFVKRDQGGEA